MNQTDAKVQNYSKASYLHVVVTANKLTKLLGEGDNKKKKKSQNGAEGVGSSPPLVSNSPQSFYNWKNFMMRGYESEDPSLWDYAVTLLSFWKEKKKGFGFTDLADLYLNQSTNWLHLPWIQSQRNPVLLCLLCIHPWNQAEPPGVARKSLGWLVSLALRGALWSLGHGRTPLLFLGCAWGGCRRSLRSFVSPRPRSACAPWHTNTIRNSPSHGLFNASVEIKAPKCILTSSEQFLHVSSNKAWENIWLTLEICLHPIYLKEIKTKSVSVFYWFTW